MVHEPAAHGTTLVQGLLERIEHEAGLSGARHPPADNAPGIDIDHEGHVHEPRPGHDISKVGEPERVRPRRPELPVDPIERARRGRVADRGPHRLAAHRALKAHGFHQPHHRAAGDRDALAGELAPDLPDPVDPEVRLKDPPDLDLQGTPSRLARRDSFSGLVRRATWAWYVDGAIGSTRQIGSTP